MYSFLLHTNIMHAINRHNEIMPTRMTFLDGAILCLIKSFHESNSPFFMSNNEMKKLFASDPGTIQRSIDRLIKMGLVSKSKEYIGNKPRRYLSYNAEAVEKFLAQNV